MSCNHFQFYGHYQMKQWLSTKCRLKILKQVDVCRNVFMFGICIFRRRYFPLGILLHISVFKTCRLSRLSLNTASFPARTNSFFLRHYFIACMLAFSFLVPNKHNWSCPSYFMCCCLSADQNLNVFFTAERSDIAEKRILAELLEQEPHAVTTAL